MHGGRGMNLELFLSLLGTLLGFAISLLTLILKLSKNKKVRKAAEQLLIITDQLNQCILEAEQFKNYTGQEKKNYVLTKMNQFSIDNHIQYDQEYISNRLEEMIHLTKNVNQNSKKKDWLE